MLHAPSTAAPATDDDVHAGRILDAAKAGDFPRMRSLLAARPHLVNRRPHGRWSALHQAAYHGDADVVRFLLALGADRAARTRDGETPAEVGTAAVRSLLAAPAPPPPAVAHTPPSELRVTDLRGQAVVFQARSAPVTTGSVHLRHPLYFAPLARMAERQEHAQPTLLVARTDWPTVSDPRVTHEGAFGRDYKDLGAVVPGSPHAWVAVWKFPGDLNGLPTFRRILDVPLPVGKYPFLLDRDWWRVPYSAPNLAQLPWDMVSVEKMRTEFAEGPSVHVLRGAHASVAMIGSHYFIRGFWEDPPARRDQVTAMLAALRRDCRIFAVPCYGQHHAIVLYADEADPGEPHLLTPRAFAKLLCTSQPNQLSARGTAIVNTLRAHALSDMRDALRPWAHNVCRKYAPS
jgi:hypothetical protein